MNSTPLKPFLKWAGGKRWLFESKQFELPSFSGRYVEPFLGGGAVFFHNKPHKAILGDANRRLVELYIELRDNVDAVVQSLRSHARNHSRDYYYKIRSISYSTSHDRAAQFLYLNRTCWNGLYRENMRGEFNVPIGTKQTVIFDNEDFSQWSFALSGASIFYSDFEKLIDLAEIGDFIFVDPPYTVRHNLNGFIKYNQKIFAWDDQVRLRDSLLRARGRGAHFAMTNADHESIRELYQEFHSQRVLSRYSVIAASSQYRSSSSELLVTSN